MSRFTTALTDIGSKISQKLANTGDSSYFNVSTRNRSALQDLKEGLASSNHEKRISSLKKIIALMANGKDVSSLFPEVISCMQSRNMIQKKLVYIYIVNTSCSRPNVAILAVNTFRTDCQDPNPLIRALALRTMSSMHLQKIVPYLIDVLKAGLSDNDPYVRRTATLAVVKAFHTFPEAAKEQGFHDKLCEKIRDNNAAVVAAALSALMDIAQAGHVPFDLRRDMVPPLLDAINGANEWGQVVLMEALAHHYRPRSKREAQAIIDRCAPRLQHANSALALAAVRVVLIFLPLTECDETMMSVHYEKLVPPLVSLLSSEPEIQFVALKSIATILDHLPDRLTFEPSTFFYPYNEPPYLKRMKIECLIRLVNRENLRTIVGELQDYTNDMDPAVARYAVGAIGRIATHYASEDCGGERSDASTNELTYCTDVLLDIFETHDRGARQEAVLHLQFVARATASPTILANVLGQLETMIPQGCDHFDILMGRTRVALATIFAIYHSELSEPMAIFRHLYPEDQMLKTLVTSEDFHALITLTFRLLSRPECSATDRQHLDLFVQALLKESHVTLDARDRTALFQNLMMTQKSSLQQLMDRSMAVVYPSSLKKPLPDAASVKSAILAIGSVSGMCIGAPYELDTAAEEEIDEGSDESRPLISKPSPSPPQGYPSASTTTKDIDGPPPRTTSDIQSELVPGARKAVAEVPSIEFDRTWEGLTKEGFIHKWHTYADCDKFSFGRLSIPSTMGHVENIRDLALALGLIYVRDRRERTFDALFFCAKVQNSTTIALIEIDIQKSCDGIKVSVRCPERTELVLSRINKYLSDNVRGLTF